MLDGDHAAARERAGVADGSGACRVNGGHRSCGEIDAAVPGQPRCGRAREAAQDLGAAVQWPAPGWIGCRRVRRHPVNAWVREGGWARR